MEILTITPIKNTHDALIVRDIRNACAQFMTRDTGKINLVKQLWWYNHSYKPLNQKGSLTVFIGYWKTTPVAYGLVQLRPTPLGEHPIISGGISASARGMGFGKQLFGFLTNYAELTYEERKPVCLEVLELNVVAKKIYDDLGFEVYGRHDGIVAMQRVYYPKDQYGEPIKYYGLPMQ